MANSNQIATGILKAWLTVVMLGFAGALIICIILLFCFLSSAGSFRMSGPTPFSIHP